MKVEIVEMFPGGGTLLVALKNGLERAGLSVSVGGLIELEARYLAVSAAAHPGATTWTGSASKWHPAELSLPNRTVARIFVAGIPCTGASLAGRAKNRLRCPEAHPQVGALFLPVLHYVRLHRPELIALECAAPYGATASAGWIREALARAGYHFEERVVNSFKEFGAPTERKRWVLVASRIGPIQWAFEPKRFDGTLEPYLDPVSATDDEESATPAQVEADSKYSARKVAEGCNFKTRFVDRTSRRCGVICKTYARRQAASVYVRTAKSYRPFRPREVARLHQFDRELFPGLSKRLQFELYGQGVVAGPFISLGEAMGDHLLGRKSPGRGQMELFGE